MTVYAKPQQPRAIATEQRLLDSLDLLLRDKSLSRLSIDEISQHAEVSRGAFLKRFGTKKQALMMLWERYGQRALVVKKQLMDDLRLHSNALDACCMVSEAIENLQKGDFSANRAMFDNFEEELTIHSVTKMVYLECVDLLLNIRRRFMNSDVQRSGCDFVAAQLMITLNYNYVLKAMPGFPSEPASRHKLIARLVVEVLKE